MRHAQLVRDRAELSERVGVLAQHPTRLEADRVQHEMGMYMLGIHMRSDDHLALRPRPRCELFCNLVRQLRRHILLRRERLRVVVEPAPAVLAVDRARGEKFLFRKLRRAVLSADELLVPRLVISLDVADRRAHRTAGLIAVADEIDRRHHELSCSARTRTAA